MVPPQSKHRLLIRAVAIDGRGNIYILERSGNALRVVDRAAKIRTVAGTGKAGDSGDGGGARARH